MNGLEDGGVLFVASEFCAKRPVVKWKTDLADVARGSKTKSTDKTSRQIGKNVTVPIRNQQSSFIHVTINAQVRHDHNSVSERRGVRSNLLTN